jgi:hypothetical protein
MDRYGQLVNAEAPYKAVETEQGRLFTAGDGSVVFHDRSASTTSRSSAWQPGAALRLGRPPLDPPPPGELF